MNDKHIGKIIKFIESGLAGRGLPVVSMLAEEKSDPFKILISTLLSLRTKDEVTAKATEKLFTLARTPGEMVCLTKEQIQEAIYPVGFYRNKSETILEICRTLIERYNARVPDSIDELLTMRGVGRKTANLVVALGFNGPGICVDIHVHRISNRLGFVETKTPEDTERVLRKKLPEKYWIKYNTLMVSFGRNICRPVSPICSICPAVNFCDRKGVAKSR